MENLYDGKTCPICYTYKPISEFGIRIRGQVNIGQGYCKKCKKIMDREYNEWKRKPKKEVNKNLAHNGR